MPSEVHGMQEVSAARFELVGDLVPSGLMVIEKAGDTVAYANRRAVELFGFDPTGLNFGKYALSVARARKLDNGVYRYDELALIRALCGEVIHNQEVTIQRPDQTELTLSVQSAPLRDNGEITGAVAVFEDVTGFKKISDALKRNEQRITDILTSIDDYVYSLDKNWDFIYVNDRNARDWHTTPKELIGKNFWGSYPLFLGTDVETNFREAMEKRQIRHFEWKTLYAMGYREFTVYPSAEGITIYGKDITERKLLQQQLEEYSKNLEKLVDERTAQLKAAERLATIGQVAGMVGHDIRNPLQSIINELYITREDAESASEGNLKQSVLENIDFIQEQVEYISKIVSDLQDYAKPLQPNLVKIDLCHFIPDALKSIHVPSGIEAAAVCQELVPSVLLDSTFLKRILSNLVTNAIQAMPNGGKLTVQAYRDNANVIITVEDTGVGIPPEAKNRVFTPLFTTKAKGQGFGLAVVKRMTEAMNGTVTFESQVGKGTKFILKFPTE